MDNSTSYKIDILPEDALVNVTISGQFYKRIQTLLFALLEQKEIETVPGLLKELEIRNPSNLWEEQVVVYTALVYAVEEAAKEQNLIVNRDFTPEVKQANTDHSEGVSPES